MRLAAGHQRSLRDQPGRKTTRAWTQLWRAATVGRCDAVGAVRRVAEVFPLALASSSNRQIFEEVLELAGLTDCFRATVSSEEVERGKPAPDVYLEAARRLGVAPDSCAAVEDSHAGIRSAKAAGMPVVAIPNASYPPDSEALALADLTLESLDELTPERIEGA